ncbi:MAG: NADH-quinone oxidoreductase subunit I [Desulfobulbus propionicus]|nr:MAG: NADH-quinone oxidoreductase subunit I [Desulfobulbus propionicus]
MPIKTTTIKRHGAEPAERIYLLEILRGMGVTLRHLLTNLRDNSRLLVRHYPEQQPEITSRWRGRHRLTTHDNGTIKCVACFMCQTNCPANCIIIEAGERQDGLSEKMPVRFDIDLSECIYCGYCVEACPMDAIRMDTGIFSVVEDDRKKMVLGIDQLLSPHGAFSEEDYKKGGA